MSVQSTIYKLQTTHSFTLWRYTIDLMFHTFGQNFTKHLDIITRSRIAGWVDARRDPLHRRSVGFEKFISGPKIFENFKINGCPLMNVIQCSQLHSVVPHFSEDNYNMRSSVWTKPTPKDLNKKLIIFSISITIRSEFVDFSLFLINQNIIGYRNKNPPCFQNVAKQGGFL